MLSNMNCFANNTNAEAVFIEGLKPLSFSLYNICSKTGGFDASTYYIIVKLYLSLVLWVHNLYVVYICKQSHAHAQVA